MIVGNLKNHIPFTIRYDTSNRGCFWFNDTPTNQPNDIFIADYYNHNMKCFDDKFGSWNLTKDKRKYVLEISGWKHKVSNLLFRFGFL